MNKNLKFYITLGLALVVLGGITLGVVGCSGLNRELPSYPEATEVHLRTMDKQSYLESGIIGQELLAFKYDAKISWSEDDSNSIRNKLDKSLPKNKWRLVNDWNGEAPILKSQWKNEEIGLVVILTENLNKPVISDLERRFGFADLQPGITLITMYVYDVSSPLIEETKPPVDSTKTSETSPAPVVN